jgi:hypothetical protein
MYFVLYAIACTHHDMAYNAHISEIIIYNAHNRITWLCIFDHILAAAPVRQDSVFDARRHVRIIHVLVPVDPRWPRTGVLPSTNECLDNTSAENNHLLRY